MDLHSPHHNIMWTVRVQSAKEDKNKQFLLFESQRLHDIVFEHRTPKVEHSTSSYQCKWRKKSTVKLHLAKRCSQVVPARYETIQGYHFSIYLYMDMTRRKGQSLLSRRPEIPSNIPILEIHAQTRMKFTKIVASEGRYGVSQSIPEQVSL